MSKLSDLQKLANELELKDVLKGAIRRFFLPDLVSKLTFVVIGIGASILLFPTPLKVLFYNALISTFNINSGAPITIGELSSGYADYWIGLVLVVLGITYNLLARILQFYSEHFVRLAKNNVAAVDRKLFGLLLSDLPSDSGIVELARHHDFGHSFDNRPTGRLEEFLLKWRHPEFMFLDPELEKKKLELYEKANEFLRFLAHKSEPIGINRQSIVPPGTNDFGWTKHLQEEVDKANSLGTEFADLHRDFILFSRTQLVC
ncbi:hypothetical protein [Massilia brevitalea]|uniref:hypothetical protein n=1 Tax=Massilia brevitalea TaxID=442526 RepID=UPI0027387F4E|nr:hypothetical protein [Massilia brevitalea]